MSYFLSPKEFLRCDQSIPSTLPSTHVCTVSQMRLRDPDEREEIVNPGEFIIVPAGVEHCPVANEECEIILLEPRTTLNTGNVDSERTVKDLEEL